MKSISILTLLTLLSSHSLIAQNTSGEVIYETKINVHKQLPPEAQQYKDRIPEFRTNHKKMYFTSEASVVLHHKDERKAKEDEEFSERRRRRRFGGDRSKDIIYRNNKTQEFSESRNFFGKQFLVKGTADLKKWKITGQQKQVGSYLCQEAILQDTTNTVAWFTPMIPAATGPGEYNGLPGLILHIDVDEGLTTITATDIQIKEIDPELMVKPTEGEQVTKEEFRKIRDEKMEERKQEFGGRGGGRTFRIGR